MKFSFIIPARNEEKNIARCIKSINAQLEPPAEIVVVDNNSSDKTAAVAKKLGCVVVKEQKRGISLARNIGAEKAQGDILCFVDADNFLDKNWTLRARKNLVDPGLNAVGGLNIYLAERTVNKIRFNLLTPFLYALYLLFELLFGKNYIVENNFAIRKKAFEEINGFDPVLIEGAWLSRKLWRQGKKAKIDLKMKIYCSSRDSAAAAI
jgi:glycosyltransferase involved in cell wall biosynthesis